MLQVQAQPFVHKNHNNQTDFSTQYMVLSVHGVVRRVRIAKVRLRRFSRGKNCNLYQY